MRSVSPNRLKNKSDMGAILYISYDGMLEPLGQSQVLRYLEKLAKSHRIILISFEKPADWQEHHKRETVITQIRQSGIEWHPLRYHKHPSAIATLYDIARGILKGLRVLRKYPVSVVHARSYVAAVMALVLKKISGIPFIFDMRGFWADERLDGGIWPSDSCMYKVAKWFEQKFLLNADCVVSLTHAAVDEMKTFSYLKRSMPRFEVITTCTDLERFTPGVEVTDANAGKPFTLGYVGSVGVWYLFDETLRCFKLLLSMEPDARLHILNRGEQEFIRQKLSEFDIHESSVCLEATDHAGVARAMQGMDAGIFFIKPVYSKMASAPTKLGEFLGCGVPCLANSGVGDMASIIERERVGIALPCFSEDALLKGLLDLKALLAEPDVATRCRRAAERHFSLQQGVKSYERIYDTFSTSV